MTEEKEEFFPSIITSLPEADLSIEGVNAYVFQGTGQQIVFMSFSRNVEIPAHEHKDQWAVVLSGEIELTIGSETKTYRKGDTYHIPEGVTHSASIKNGYSDVSLFNQKDRFNIK